ncbi:SPFH domain-containing protein [Streptomyces sp. H10-C2]|uniref:SPFH domain-containing protein n=1 Tax=unclassified Streptomyces TaxID=2593676 RepID=UPI0024B889CC|nr:MULTISPECIES: SPFH domain-containing protein [unclassified Streptomyces]MDJ0344676.1 SPFH domain-containing protein [Streptomyces sp. PH10-H1]MDJ0372840.1 SPFH domain-containing protein [Streptomyces sp. H10-C2]
MTTDATTAEAALSASAVTTVLPTLTATAVLPTLTATAVLPTVTATAVLPTVTATVPDITERPGRFLPGWTAALTGLAAAAAGAWLLWRTGALPEQLAGRAVLPEPPAPRDLAGLWGAVLLLGALTAFALGGLTRGRPGNVWVLTRHGAYQGSVRDTGLLWISPLLGRRRMDVTLRHWRSRVIETVDADGTPLHASVLIVWRVRDTARAAFAIDDHSRYLREQVESAVARAFSRLPVDDFRGTGPTLRDGERLGDQLTRLLAADMRPVGVEVFSAQPVRLDYAPEVAAAMRRAQVSALDAKHRRAVLDDVLGAVAETVRGLTDRGLVQLDDYERRSLVRDLTVAFYTSRGPLAEVPKK